MKKTIFVAAIILATFAGFGNYTQAQVGVHLNVGIQPLWGPTGYDYARYYYIPDIEAYYDVDNQTYVYMNDGRWVTTTYLPPWYADFDLYGAYKVVINTPSPWLRHNRYRGDYYGYRGRHDQVVIRDSRDQRYWANPGHPRHNNWHGNEMRHEQHRDWGGNRPGSGYDHGRNEGPRRNEAPRHNEGPRRNEGQRHNDGQRHDDGHGR